MKTHFDKISFSFYINIFIQACYQTFILLFFLVAELTSLFTTETGVPALIFCGLMFLIEAVINIFFTFKLHIKNNVMLVIIICFQFICFFYFICFIGLFPHTMSGLLWLNVLCDTMFYFLTFLTSLFVWIFIGTYDILKKIIQQSKKIKNR